MELKGGQRPRLVRHIGRRHMQCVGPTLRIRGQMSLDPRDFLARVIPLSGPPYPCSSRSVHPRYKSSPSPCSQIACGPRQRIFLSFLLKRSPPSAPVSHSRSENIHGRCATSESLPEAFAIDTHCAVRRARHKTRHTNPRGAAWSSCAPSPRADECPQIARV